MDIKHTYWYFKSALSKEFCEKVISLGNKKIEDNKKLGQSVEGITFGDKQKSKDLFVPINDLALSDVKDIDNIDKMYARDSEISWLNDDWIYDEILPRVYEANKSSGWKYDFDAWEDFQFTTYHAPGGFYGWHSDMASDHNAALKRYIHGITDVPLKENGDIPFGYTRNNHMVGKIRKLSVTVNLTSPEEYEGGNLKFDLGKHNKGGQFHEADVAREQGTIIVFPSYINHCVTPVTRGTRYSLVLWCSGRPFK